MKQNKTNQSDYFFKIDECADVLTRPRNKCAANIDESKYVEFNIYDVVAINKRHPNTFIIPNEDVRNLVVPGMLVKIYADWCSSDSLDERFWVRITDVNTLEFGDKVFYAEAVNDTAFVPSGAYLGPILHRNICDVDLEEFVQRHQQRNSATAIN